MDKLRIGFIGFGNMAQAMARGLLRGACAPELLCACAAHYDALCLRTEPLGIRALRDPCQVAEAADLLVLAVLPENVPEIAVQLKDKLHGKLLLSVVAGLDYERCEALFPGSHHISTIPNTPISVGQGVLICQERHSLTPEEYQRFAALLGQIALVETVPDAAFSAGGTLGGCTPAFAALFMEALGDAGVRYGIPRETAYRIAAQVLVGSGSLLLESGQHPGQLKDAVCSPGGSTIRGVEALEQAAFRGALLSAFRAIED